MRNEGSKAYKVYLASLIFGIFLVAIELLLSFTNRSICPSEGCKIAENLLLIPKQYMLIIAIIYFISLLLLGLFYRSSKGQLFKFLLLIFIGVGFTGDWFLVFKLIWEYNVKCYFCLTIAGLVTATAFSGVYMLSRDRVSYPGLLNLLLGSLLGLLGAFVITTPPADRLDTIGEKTLIVYAKGCSRCEELLQDPNFRNLPKIPVASVYSFLKIVGIDSLPVIIEKREEDVRIFVPKEKRLEESSCQPLPQGGLCVLP